MFHDYVFRHRTPLHIIQLPLLSTTIPEMRSCQSPHNTFSLFLFTGTPSFQFLPFDMFSFHLKDLPFAVLNLVTMPICWMKKGFENLIVNHQAKVMWDTLHCADHEIEGLQGTVARLEKELTAWNVFAPIIKQTIEDFAKYKSDREYEKEYPFGYPETPEAKKKQHEICQAKDRRATG